MDAHTTENSSTELDNLLQDVNLPESLASSDLESSDMFEMLAGIEDSMPPQHLESELADYTQKLDVPDLEDLCELDLTLETDTSDAPMSSVMNELTMSQTPELEIADDLNSAFDLDSMSEASLGVDEISLPDSPSHFDLASASNMNLEPMIQSESEDSFDLATLEDEISNLSSVSSETDLESDMNSVLELLPQDEVIGELGADPALESSAEMEMMPDLALLSDVEIESNSDMTLENEASPDLAEFDELSVKQDFPSSFDDEATLESVDKVEFESSLEDESDPEMYSTLGAMPSNLPTSSEPSIEPDSKSENSGVSNPFDLEANLESVDTEEADAEMTLADEVGSDFSESSDSNLESEPLNPFATEVTLEQSNDIDLESSLEVASTPESSNLLEAQLEPEISLVDEAVSDLNVAEDQTVSAEALNPFAAEVAFNPVPTAEVEPHFDGEISPQQDDLSELLPASTEENGVSSAPDVAQSQFNPEPTINPEDFQALQVEVRQLTDKVNDWEKRYEELSQKYEQQTKLLNSKIEPEVYEKLNQELLDFHEQVKTLQTEKNDLEESYKLLRSQSDAKVDRVEYDAVLVQIQRLKEKNARGLWARIMDWIKGS